MPCNIDCMDEKYLTQLFVCRTLFIWMQRRNQNQQNLEEPPRPLLFLVSNFSICACTFFKKVYV